MRGFVHSKDLTFLAIFFGSIVLLIFSIQIESSTKIKSVNTASVSAVFQDEEIESKSVATSTVENEAEKPLQTISKEQANVVVSTPPKKASEKSVFIYDINDDKVIFSENENLLLPLASMTKIMTAIVALEELSSESIVIIDQKSLDTFGESGLELEERWKVSSLVKFMLVTSSNDAATALKNQVNKNGGNFIASMNEKARELSLKDTLFINETGLDQSTKTGGSYGSARDIAMLMSYAVDNFANFFEPTRYKEYNLVSDSGISHKLENTNTEVESIPNVVASKTGYTELAGGNLVFIFRTENNHLVVISILGSTKDGRFEDAKKYTDLAIKEI